MNADLKKRIPTAIAYVMVVAGSLLFGQMTAALLIILFWTACQNEYLHHSGELSRWMKIGIAVVSVLFMLAGLTPAFPAFVWQGIILLSVIIFTLNGALLIRTGSSQLNRLPVAGQTLLYLIVPFSLTIYMLMNSPQYNLTLLGLFILIWLNDAGAYFTGRAFGRHKLLPAVSPNKTWEGFIGGGMLTFATGAIFYYASQLYSLEIWLVMAILIFIYSVVGDLVESAWKRYYGIKDTGTALPGHGGFLDRLDSFIYCAPVLACAVIILEK